MQQKHKTLREGTHILQPQWFFTLHDLSKTSCTLWIVNYSTSMINPNLNVFNSFKVSIINSNSHVFNYFKVSIVNSNSHVFNYFNDSMINPNLHVFNSDPLIVGEDRSWADRVEVDLCFDVDKKIEKIFDFVAFRRRIVVRCIGQACSFDLKNYSNKIVVKMSIKNTQLC